jgi:hypothetical protein
MATPNYTVRWGYYQDHSAPADTWDEAKRILAQHAGEQNLTIHGAGYDADCDEDGFFVCSTGLTEDESFELDEMLESFRLRCQ